MPPVHGVRASDTGRDITDLLNRLAAQYHFEATDYLGLIIAESNLYEHAYRDGVWPDCSPGLTQPAIAWLSRAVPGLTRNADGTVQDTPSNREAAKAWCFDAANVLPYSAPIFAGWLAHESGDALNAMCRYNWPGQTPADNPNRANYVRGLAAAAAYAVSAPVAQMTQDQARQLIVAKAHTLLGTPYIWGAPERDASGVDCSGLIEVCYAAAGLDTTPHRATWMLESQCELIDQSQCQPGDLVFFYGTDPDDVPDPNSASHVGLWLGQDQMIDAPQEGEAVLVESISRGHGGYWAQHRPRFGRHTLLAALPAGSGSPSPQPTPPPTDDIWPENTIVVLAEDAVNFRAQPSTGAATFGQFGKGARFLVLDDASEAQWTRVVRSIGGQARVGWVWSSYVREVP